MAVCFGGERLVQHLVDGFEEVPSEGDHALASALAQLDEVVDEHVGGAERPIVGAV